MSIRDWFRINERPIVDSWTEFASHIAITDELAAKLQARHPALGSEDLEIVAEAERQWVRIEGRNALDHTLPSRAVQTVQLMRGLGPPDLPQMDPSYSYPDNPGPDMFFLLRTYFAAFVDERPIWGGLPVVFRVDEEVCWPDGLRYRVHCQEKICPTEAFDGRICLHHSAGPGDGGSSGGGVGDALW